MQLTGPVVRELPRQLEIFFEMWSFATCELLRHFLHFVFRTDIAKLTNHLGGNQLAIGSFRAGPLLSSAVALSALFGVQFASAAEFVVDAPTTVTNGDMANVLDGNDGLSVTDTGSITTAGADAVNATGDANTIVNAGALSTVGDHSEGIKANTNFNSIANSGSITTTGASSEGIQVNNSNTVTNAGNITTQGNFAEGILGGNDNEITNTGNITTSGKGSDGIDVFINSTVTNTGRIFTTGAGARGVIVRDGSTVNNSGYVVSAQSNSFEFTSGNYDFPGNAVLNLMAPSFIGGPMKFDIQTTVNITTGRSHSVLWDFSNGGGMVPDMNFAGDVPWAWDAVTSQFATLDPTALSAAPDVLADSVGSLSTLVRSDGAPDYNDWWLRGFGNSAGYGAQGVFNDYQTLNGGIAGGGSFVLNEDFSLEFMIGYQATYLHVNSAWMTSQTIYSDGIVGAVSASMDLEEFFADFTLFGGAQSNTSRRLVNDNLAPLGVSYADGTFDSWFIAPELRIGVDIETDGAWTLTPSATARYSLQQIDAYTETGSNANATIGVRQVQVFEGNLELAATRDIDSGTFTLRGGVQYRQNLGGPTEDITLLGQALSMPVNTGSKLIGYAGADVSYEIGDMAYLDASANIAVGQNNFVSVFGSFGIRSQF